ncbi:MAG: hypothetical protein JWP67_625 [Mucilaginibacter sp.]|jgi:hypothetical protein|nr:hypothetical protein [Mucilaginibacter sp.]MDB5060782.1 hypothetical protein [Mucilaginibacter sp.]
MHSLKNAPHKLSNALTCKVIDLHDQGYINDFLPTSDHKLLCIQDCEDFSVEDIDIQVVDQQFDQLTNTYKYIHTIETINGSKGLMLTDFICTKGFLMN